jgi:transposase-like protein
MVESRPWQNAELMHHLHVEQGKTVSEIARELDCSNSTVCRWLKRFDIEVINGPREVRDKAFLKREYVDKGKSSIEIASELGCSPGVITKWLDRHELPVRDCGGDPEYKRFDVECDQCGASIVRNERQLEERNWSFCDHGCWGDWLSENRSGEDNPLFEGGDQKQIWYGPEWETQRQKAIERDSGECRACGMSREQHKETFGADLHVHHVIPFDNFESHEAANDLGNLVTACLPCHRRYEGLQVFPK